MKRTTDKPYIVSMLVISIFAFTGFASAQIGSGGGESKLNTAVACYLGTSGKVNGGKARTLFLEASKEGDSMATMWLARCYLKGRAGFTKDEQKAQNLAKDVIKSIEQMAQDGNAHAMTLLASALEEGLGVTSDPNRALSLYRVAADRGDILAMDSLGVILNLAKEEQQAEILLRRSAQAGSTFGMANIGRLLVSRDKPEEAVGWYRKGAEHGSPLCMRILGCAYLYENSLGVQRDREEGLSWLTRAFQAGCADAAFHLAEAHRGGEGVQTNPKEVVNWLRKGADLGSAKCMRMLGLAYWEMVPGLNVPTIDTPAGYALLVKAFEAGEVDAAVDIGNAFEIGLHTKARHRRFEAADGDFLLGLGVRENPKQAANWYRKGAEAGSIGCISKLIQCYQKEKETGVTFAELMELSRKEVERGSKFGYVIVAQMLCHGIDDEKNKKEAKDYLESAAKAGNADAQAALAAKAKHSRRVLEGMSQELISDSSGNGYQAQRPMRDFSEHLRPSAAAMGVYIP